MRARTLFVTAALLAGLVGPAQAADPVAPGLPTGSFTVAGAVARPVTLTVAELAQFPVHATTATYGTGKGGRIHTYRGALLSDVLAFARPVLAAGTTNPALRMVVTLVASDGYQVSLAYGEIDPVAGNRPILLSFWRDGRALNTEGPGLVLEGDDHGGRFADDIRTITVSQQSFPPPPSAPEGALVVTGAVNEPKTFSWTDLNFMPQQFQTVTYTNANGASETHTERGVGLDKIIEAAGGLALPPGAKNGMLRFVINATTKTEQAVVDYGHIDPEGAGIPVMVSLAEDTNSFQSSGGRLIVPSDRGAGRYVVGLHTLTVAIPQASTTVPAALADDGVRVVTGGGIITSEGGASSRGDLSGKTLTAPIVAADTASIPDGYWLAASDGGIFNFGGAPFLGSLGAIKLNKPIVDIAATMTGKGYWLVASDGGVFAFGDAGFSGSLGALKLSTPIVDIAATPTGMGYWLVASDGGVFSFGDADFFGSLGGMRLAQPVVSAAATPSGRGYWLLGADGGVFSFGDAFYAGRDPRPTTDAVKLVPSAAGTGYRIVHSDATVASLGKLPPLARTSSPAKVVTATA